MVELVIPIHVEEGEGPSKYSQKRNRSDAAMKKPLRKKNSRQKCKTFNIKIELEGGNEGAERKNGISSKTVSVPSSKLTKRRSSKNLRSVISKQSASDLRTGMMRRQSSRDIVTGCSNRIKHKEPNLSDMMLRQTPGDVCLPSLDEKFTIRRDSINGLRIISKLDQTQTEALAGLADIALSEGEENVKFTKFQTDALKTHNQLRARHGAEDLVLSSSLCARAQEYSDTLATTDTFQHSQDPDLGENLYWSWSSDPKWKCGGAEPVTSWYEECRGYRYDREPRDPQSGHFTQVVWADCRRLGVGVSQSSATGKFYVVMKYDPPGNIIGSYTSNVNRPNTDNTSINKL